MNILPILAFEIKNKLYAEVVKALIASVNMKSYLVLVALLFGLLAQGQENFYFEQIGTDDGLSQSDVNCIYQDSYGYMWFGTHDGLNRYDGYSFAVFKPDQKSTNINSNLIYAMTGDQNGNLWIGSTGDGLFYYDKKKETFKQFKFNKEDDYSISNNYITRLYIDSKNRLWIATKEDVNMVDLSVSVDSVKFEKFKFVIKDTDERQDGSVINSIYENSDGEILLGGHLGIYQLKLDAGGKSYFKLISDEIGFGTESVGVIAQDRYNKYIVGTGQGLFVQNNDKEQKFIKIREGNFTSLAFDDMNHIWAGTDNGLLYFDNSSSLKQPRLIKTFSYKPEVKNSISKNIITSLFIDRTGILWVGTNGGGVNKFDPNRKKFKHVKRNLKENSLSYDKIRSIFEDSNGTFWVGTEGGGLNKGESDKEKYAAFTSTNELRKVFALEEITIKNRKFLLAGGQSHPYLFKIDITNPKDNTPKITSLEGIHRSVFSLLNDSQDNLWIGTYSGGLYRWIKNPDGRYSKQNFKENTSDVNSLANNIVRNIYEDSKGNIWIATGDGLSQLTITEKYKEHPKFKNYKKDEDDPSSLSHNYILSLFENRKGELWIGTFGGGLNKLIPGENGEEATFKNYSIAQGLPNNVIKAILEDEQGHLWVSTNKGLSMFDTEQEIFKNFDVSDGLQDSEFQELASLKRKDGELVFGGINGFNAFYPREINDNKTAPETVVTKLSIFNEEVAVGEEINGRVLLEKNISEVKDITLEYSENSFSFEFSSLHFSAPRKNQYAYKLEGFDNDWVYTSSDKRFATYTNIEPGNYTLKVKSSNNDGLWDNTPYTLQLTVRPPIYRTTVAYIIYGLLLLLLLAGLWRFTIISNTKKHQLELEHLEKEKNDELQTLKLDFFTNISHEFKTPLTLIKAPLEYLLSNKEEIGASNLKEQYQLMHKNTNYLLRLVNQLLDFRKINQGKMSLVVRHTDIVFFIKEVAEPFQLLAFKKSVKFNIVSSQEHFKTWFDHNALEKVINNLLSNAFKFTPEGGEIIVEIDVDKNGPTEKENVIIKVKDNGLGISDVKKNIIFEKYYTEKENEKVNSKGVGIGLAFTKSLVELHLGSISVENNEGGGSCFIVTLPTDKQAYENAEDISCKEITDNDYLVRSSEAESLAIDLNDELEDYNLSKVRSKNPVLLIVDDNPDIIQFIKQVMGKTYTVFEANNGERGMEIAKKVLPNIIITDVVMPVMGGIEFCEMIKTTNITSHIPVIMLTAKTSQESEIEGLSHGADAYLKKPFNVQVLELKVANILKDREELRKRFKKEITLQPKEVTVTSLDEKFLQQAVETVEKHMMNTDFNVEMLVKEMGHSRSNLYLKFKELTGLSSSEFIRNIRLKRAIQLLDNSDFSVKEIMFRTGFNTASYFSKCFKKEFGVVPSEYIKKTKVEQD
ncbi:hybrid sensor histidine kinase/response regulator transcription factor [uncultured Maribacter sp.]|uniref:hybrid sensor histidine kinase/response regulator transcription factor n=1 Tax=uncultured Maribacter sp. TaxID=431308 RepID=UPI002616AD08|nr:hybrid sensor histidine kinase/response regulator transcription factor [uncultured Maribacter sp.]